MPTEQPPTPTERPQNTAMPILLAIAVLVFATIVTVAASLYFRENPPPGAGPAATSSPSASATPSGR